MSTPERIYLDNAATSWPKPEAVYRAVDDYQRRLGASVGRSAYAEAVEAASLVRRARHAVAELLSAPADESIVFAANGTDALNLALHGLLKRGDKVVTTDAEHNSVLRPLRQLADEKDIEVRRVPCDPVGRVDAAAMREALSPKTRLVAITHASNVTGAIQPIEEITRDAHAAGAVVLVDAAQTLGCVPIDVGAVGVDLLAAPGHKGLLGPLGTGVLYLRPGMESEVWPVRQGGTGSESESDRQPSTGPERYESGNHNGPAIAGLAAGIAYLKERGVEDVMREHAGLCERLVGGFEEMESVRVVGPKAGDRRVSVVSVTVDGYAPQEFAALLDQAFRVQVRAGFHCAPAIHRTLGTSEGGTVRFSVGVFTTPEAIDAAIAAVGELSGSGNASATTTVSQGED